VLNIFRTNQLIVNTFLLFYAGVLHLSAILWPDMDWTAPQHGALTDWVYQWIGSTGRWAELAATVLVFVQAVILNVFFSNNRITRDYTLFPGLFYILIASAIPEFLHLSPLLLANTFYLLAYKELFDTYRRPSAAAHIFNSGFWLGVAGLFYFSYVGFLIWGFVGLNIMRAFRIRERFMLLIGLLTPYILMGVYQFYVDQWDGWIQSQFVDSFDWLDFQKATSQLLFVKLGLLGLLLLVLLLGYGSASARRTIDVQKKVNLMYWGLLFGGLTLLIQAGITIEHVLILAVPMGMLLSIAFAGLSNRWAEAWHIMLAAAILFFQYHTFFLPFRL
jgi:hypothetical protein